jgi:hypothetical protein
MKFLGLFTRGALGSAATMFVVSMLLAVVFFGQAALGAWLPLLIQSVFTGLTFGILFGVFHLKRETTLVSSLVTGVAYIVLSIALNVVLGGGLVIGLGLLIGVLVNALVLGGGAFIGTRIARR